MKTLSLLLISLVACGGSSARKSSDMTSPPSTTAPAQVHELTWYEGDDLAMRLHTDGRLEIKSTHTDAGRPPVETWKEAFTVTADGAVVQGDKPVGKLDPSGTFTMADGTKASFQIDGAALVVGDKRIEIAADGTVAGGNPAMRPMRVEGATAPEAKRTALLVMGLVFATDGRPAPAPPPSAHSD